MKETPTRDVTTLEELSVNENTPPTLVVCVEPSEVALAVTVPSAGYRSTAAPDPMKVLPIVLEPKYPQK